MRWGTYFAVTAAVVIVGLALGVTLPLVSLRLESWGYGPFAIGVMAAMPAVGVLLGARLTGRLAGALGTPRTLRLCLLASAFSVGLLALLPYYPLWLLLRLLIGISLTVVFVLGESWINQLVEERLRGRLVALYGTGFALSQLAGPLALTVIGSASDLGFWLSVALLVGAAPCCWATAARRRSMRTALPGAVWGCSVGACRRLPGPWCCSPPSSRWC